MSRSKSTRSWWLAGVPLALLSGTPVLGDPLFGCYDHRMNEAAAMARDLRGPGMIAARRPGLDLDDAEDERALRPLPADNPGEVAPS